MVCPSENISTVYFWNGTISRLYVSLTGIIDSVTGVCNISKPGTVIYEQVGSRSCEWQTGVITASYYVITLFTIPNTENHSQLKRKTLSITKQKSKKTTQKSSRMRRQRGYHWEDTLVKRLNNTKKWKSFRLGSSSIALPDVLAVNSEESTIYAIEAKSGTSTSLPVPANQIERCLDWIQVFSIYKKRDAILAFKFISKRRIGLGEYKSRELREYYKIWDESLKITDCVCTYDGRFFAKIDGTRKELFLKECRIPFKTKQRNV